MMKTFGYQRFTPSDFFTSRITSRAKNSIVLRILITKQVIISINCYDISYQCWFASEEANIYCNNFNSSNAVVKWHLNLAYSIRLAIINAAELGGNGRFFFLPLLRNVVLWLKRTSTKSLQIELVTKYDTNNA